ncbi:MAG: CHRD domain-containing protein [Gammaproteobacteria bacterium]
MAQNRVVGVGTLMSLGTLMSASALASTVTAELNGFDEVPSIRSEATGSFRATLNESGNEVSYTLTYSDVATPVQFAHLHFAQRGVNGGVAVWLCDNSGSAPSGVQVCPNDSGTVEGTIGTADIVGPVDQGLAAGDLTGLLRAIGAGSIYANVHSEAFPGGEIRGQLEPEFGIE